jgi:hypothetical protein
MATAPKLAGIEQEGRTPLLKVCKHSVGNDSDLGRRLPVEDGLQGFLIAQQTSHLGEIQFLAIQSMQRRCQMNIECTTAILIPIQPPFSPIRSGPNAASKPSRQKQIPSSQPARFNKIGVLKGHWISHPDARTCPNETITPSGLRASPFLDLAKDLRRSSDEVAGSLPLSLQDMFFAPTPGS